MTVTSKCNCFSSYQLNRFVSAGLLSKTRLSRVAYRQIICEAAGKIHAALFAGRHEREPGDFLQAVFLPQSAGQQQHLRAGVGPITIIPDVRSSVSIFVITQVNMCHQTEAPQNARRLSLCRRFILRLSWELKNDRYVYFVRFF